MKKPSITLASEVRAIGIELLTLELAKYGRVLDAVEANRIVYPPAGYQKVARLASTIIVKYWKSPDIAEVIVLSPALMGIRSNIGFEAAFKNGLMPLPARVSSLWTARSQKARAAEGRNSAS